MSPEILRVFVYGTLKPGEANYSRYCAGKVVEVTKAMTRGKLYSLPLGYPAMTTGDNLVYGYLLSFNDWGVLSELDNLEDYHTDRPPSANLYNRVQTEIYHLAGDSQGFAWVYIMSEQLVEQFRGIPQVDGCWSGETGKRYQENI